MKWISVEKKLPKIVTGYNQAEKWKLCSTIDGAILLSLCYYDHLNATWYDNNGPEKRVAFWTNLKSPNSSSQTQTE